MKIDLGILASHLSIQLDNQNVKYDNKIVEQFQLDRDALNRVRIRNMMAKSHLDKGYDKLGKMISKHLNEFNEKY